MIDVFLIYIYISHFQRYSTWSCCLLQLLEAWACHQSPFQSPVQLRWEPSPRIKFQNSTYITTLKGRIYHVANLNQCNPIFFHWCKPDLHTHRRAHSTSGCFFSSRILVHEERLKRWGKGRGRSVVKRFPSAFYWQIKVESPLKPAMMYLLAKRSIKLYSH